MARIGICALITRWKGNLMECTRTIHPTSTMNGINLIIGREKPTKRAGPREQGMVKTKLEILEVEIFTMSSQMQSEICNDCVMSYNYITQIIGIHNQSK